MAERCALMNPWFNRETLQQKVRALRGMDTADIHRFLAELDVIDPGGDALVADLISAARVLGKAQLVSRDADALLAEAERQTWIQ
jgi:hypothetical protein